MLDTVSTLCTANLFSWWNIAV